MNKAPYRALSTDAGPDPYVVAWADLRKRRKRSLIALLVVLPVGIVIAAWADAALQHLLPVEPALVLLLPLIGVISSVLVHMGLFACPRCGTRRSWVSPCPRCGIFIGTSKAQADEAERVRLEADAAYAKARPPPRRPHLD